MPFLNDEQESNSVSSSLRSTGLKLTMEKTYSRKPELCAASGKKKDPFDELLLSPLKQEVNFMPLSFWDSESKKKDSKWRSCRIIKELYDSDDLDSPSKNISSFPRITRLSNPTANASFDLDASDEEPTLTESPFPFKSNDKVIKGLQKDNFTQPYPCQEKDVFDLGKKISEITISDVTCRDLLAEASYNQATVFENMAKSEKVSCAALSRSSMMFDKSFMNHTIKVTKTEKSSSLKDARDPDPENSIGEDSSLKGAAKESSFIEPRDFLLRQCGQEEVLPFEEYFNERTLINCKKIGEGVCGEVFMFDSDSVIKIIPIEGAYKENGELQKTFKEIIPEVLIASKLSNLRYGRRYKTSGFSEIKRCWFVVGKYPDYLLRLWDEYDQAGSGSENYSPATFKSNQLYVILELIHGGQNLESCVFRTSTQSLSVLVQCAFSLAAAEKAFQFEHRDLHWGNLLVAPTKDKFVTVVLNDLEYKIPTKGVKVSIIDFTLSRISDEGRCIFYDLSADPCLFTSQGDYQFEIYRMMQRAINDDWSLFVPKTNIYWLHYTIDKMLKMVRYKFSRGKVQKKGIKLLKSLESVIMEYNNSFDFVLEEDLISVLR